MPNHLKTSRRLVLFKACKVIHLRSYACTLDPNIMRACSNAINLTGFSVLVVHSCYDRPGVLESSVLFLGLVSQVSGPTQALGWWKRAKERTHYCWLWAWLSRKWPRNENTFEGVIIPCSKFTINVALLPLLRVKYWTLWTG